jgi:hypothetical protein
MKGRKHTVEQIITKLREGPHRVTVLRNAGLGIRIVTL